jgi:hypothetical protein
LNERLGSRPTAEQICRPLAGLSEFRLISVTDIDFRRNSCLDRIRSKMIALKLVYNHFWLVV